MARELIVYVANSEVDIPSNLKEFSRYFKHFIAETSELFLKRESAEHIQRYINNKIDWKYFSGGGHFPSISIEYGEKYKPFLDHFRKINESRKSVGADLIEFVPTPGTRSSATEEETIHIVFNTLKTLPRNGKSFLITKPWLVIYDFLVTKEKERLDKKKHILYRKKSKFEHSIRFLELLRDADIKITYVGKPRANIRAQLKTWDLPDVELRSLPPKRRKK